MTESGVIQMVTLILGVVGPILTIWVKGKLDSVHKELNSRLDEYKAALAKKADAAEIAALTQGIAQGIELERRRQAKTADEVLATAQVVAKEVIATAREEKKKNG